MSLTYQERTRILGIITIALACAGIVTIAGIENYLYNSEQNQVVSDELGFSVIDVQDAELTQVNEDFKATIYCVNKETKQKIVIEYDITATDFIVMNQPDYDPWEYISVHIIPVRDPSFVGTLEDYANQKNESRQSQIVKE